MDLLARVFGQAPIEMICVLGLGLVIFMGVALRVRRTRRNVVMPDWEPSPWDLTGRAAREQQKGFKKRKRMPIIWRAIPWKSFPPEGIFGTDKNWFSNNDVRFIATCDGEELILIQNTWHGFPDPPEWGLASRPIGQSEQPWSPWGFFPALLAAWSITTSD